MKEIQNPYPGQECFFCGQKNDIGLKLKFFVTNTDPPQLLTRLNPPDHLKGLGRILHGGFQSGLFDEIMGWTTHYLTGKMGVTSNLEVKFKKPLFVGQPIEVRCHIADQRGPAVHLEATITDQQGRICSTATGTYITMDTRKFNAIVGQDEITAGRERIQP